MADQQIVVAKSRLPCPPGQDEGKWRVLVEAIFPNATSTDAIMLALEYCKARGLDVMKRPVNIVPIWSSTQRKMVETIWPSINEIETTAARTGAWCGMDEPKFGPDVTRTFSGRRKVRDSWQEVDEEVEFPAWCSITVYRLVGGQRCAFTEPVYWIEAYGRSGSLPNDQWVRRPRGMLIKVAKAMSLRAAFPEEADYSSDEMEAVSAGEPPPPLPPEPKWTGPQSSANGQGEASRPTGTQTVLPPENAPSAPAATASPPPMPGGEPPPAGDHDPETGEVGPRTLEVTAVEDGSHWRDWTIGLKNHIERTKTLEEVDAWLAANKTHIETLEREAAKLHARFNQIVGQHKVRLAQSETPR